MKKLILLAFFIIIWGPHKIFGIDPSRTLRSSFSYEFDKSAYFEIIMWTAIFLIFMYYIFRKIVLKIKLLPKETYNSPILFYFLFCIMCFISSLYSGAFFVTGFKAMKIFLTLMIVLIVYFEKKFQQFNPLKFIYYYAIILCFYKIIMLIVFPGLVGKETIDGYRLVGGFPFMPDFGFYSAVAMVYSLNKIFTQKDKKFINALIFAIAIFTLSLSRVRSVMAPALFTIVIYFLTIRSFKIKYLLLIILLVISINGFYEKAGLFIIRNPESLRTMSQRREVWEFISPSIKSKIFFGYGLGVGGKMAVEPYWPVNIGDTHNAWTESLISVGLIGTIPLALSLVLAFYLIIKNRRNDFDLAVQLFCLLVLILGSSIASINLTEPLPLYAIILSIVYLRFRRKVILRPLGVGHG